jgi:arsenate reductase-like glutaredoxin family protein
LNVILAAAASPAEVLNTRHKVAKENGWKERAPSKTAFRKAALEENNLLRRPILVRAGKLVVGKDLDAIRALIG